VSPAYLNVADRTWPLLHRAMGLHTVLYRATGGVVGHRIPGLRAPILLLFHVGAKSGKPRTSPLLYIPDGDDYVIVASKGGYPRHPAWFHNLRAKPDVAVQVGSAVQPVRARVAAGSKRERLWRRAVELYSPYAEYQERTERQIPLVVLEPR
jgi:deazaflavin-dependent oxidoreductase (nitroreductase family)